MSDAATPIRSAQNDPPRRGEPISRAHYRISAAPAPFGDGLRELLTSRDLFGLLLNRELQVRYKQTALGVAWVILQPLVPAVILAVVLGTFARLPSSGVPYLLFVLSGLVAFGLFSGAVSRAGGSPVRDSQLIAKVYFPRAILPLASGSAAVVDFAIGLVIVIVAMVALGHTLPITFLLIPVLAALALVLGLGLGLTIAALSAHYRDFGHAVPFVLQVLLYGSPVAYSTEILPPSLGDLYALNPLVPLIEAFRWSLLGTPAPEVGQVVLGSATGLVIVAVGIFIFARVSRDMADVI